VIRNTTFRNNTINLDTSFPRFGANYTIENCTFEDGYKIKHQYAYRDPSQGESGWTSGLRRFLILSPERNLELYYDQQRRDYDLQEPTLETRFPAHYGYSQGQAFDEFGFGLHGQMVPDDAVHCDAFEGIDGNCWVRDYGDGAPPSIIRKPTQVIITSPAPNASVSGNVWIGWMFGGDVPFPAPRAFINVDGVNYGPRASYVAMSAGVEHTIRVSPEFGRGHTIRVNTDTDQILQQLREQLAEVESQIENGRRAVMDLQSEIDSLSQQISSLEAEQAEAVSEQDAQYRVNEELQQQAEAIQRQIDELEQ
jgi:hypothetical protein